MRSSRRHCCDPQIERELGSPQWSEHQHETYRRLRTAAPICWSPVFDEWLVSTFDLVDSVLAQPTTFSNVGEEAAHIDGQPEATRAVTPTLRHHFGGLQLNISDPPEHARLRRGFNRPFVPRRLASFEPRVEAIADELMDKALSDGPRCDAIASLAAPLPVRVIAEFMGVEARHLDAITTVTRGQRYFFGGPDPGVDVALDFDASVSEWRSILATAIEARRHDQRDDVLTVAAALVDEGVASEDEVIATCLHLVIAGNSTTTALIGNVLALLLTHRNQHAAVANRPQLIAAAVEETLRFEPPLPTVRRIATTDCMIGGQRIEAGEQVCCVLASAGRDPAVFERPDEFDVTRSISLRQQSAFGRGIHTCVGAALARMEAAVAVRTILRRLPEVEIEAGHQPCWHEVRTHRSLTTLPLVAR